MRKAGILRFLAICNLICFQSPNICVTIDCYPYFDRPMRILVVEDDPIIAQLIETILEPQKYAVDFAIDGQMGLDLSDAYEYDAILLDVSLPKKDGISVCRQIRSQGNTVPILLLTALDSPAIRDKLRKSEICQKGNKKMPNCF
ncbi:response regulator [Chamaesiphon minutus]|uniref:Response regulator with CheY-like receiver domain and winged-helix DNA-binding domain n=1 Tax=Chamaesiphon minutus (strain ATCC 27169 / PCC 6605) TaxID=1173020 RepID=K9UBN5_CHAP6|nr:response regulator [Chamaesiphon minutus]AFY92517.1 response regulator with CheY-like receiver domain and winged-helix DNA-binding domain [Chamaesiphon minutus PCC 6605]